MMNWCDVVVISIIGIFVLIGLKNGFIFSIFRLASFFISVFVSMKFYQVVSAFLVKIGLHEKIQASILKNLLQQKQVLAPEVDKQAKLAAADSVIKHMKLPGFFKETLINKMPNPSKLVDLSDVMENISGELASAVINVISLILLYIIIRVALIFARVLLKQVAKLPIFKQMDKLGGFAFGAVEGLLTVNILFAVLMLFNSNPKFANIFTALENSMVASFFYQNNFIISWMFG